MMVLDNKCGMGKCQVGMFESLNFAVCQPRKVKLAQLNDDIKH